MKEYFILWDSLSPIVKNINYLCILSLFIIIIYIIFFVKKEESIQENEKYAIKIGKKYISSFCPILLTENINYAIISYGIEIINLEKQWYIENYNLYSMVVNKEITYEKINKIKKEK